MKRLADLISRAWETTLVRRRDSDEIQPRRTMIRYVGQFTEQIARRIRGRLLRILSRSVDSLDSLSLSSSYPLARALPSKIDLVDRSRTSEGEGLFEKWSEPRFYASVLVVNVPSMSRSRFTESRFTQCYVTATHLSFEAVRSPRIHHASLTLFSLPLTDPLLLCAQFLKNNS